jgi:hypothetical protein
MPIKNSFNNVTVQPKSSGRRKPRREQNGAQRQRGLGPGSDGAAEFDSSGVPDPEGFNPTLGSGGSEPAGPARGLGRLSGFIPNFLEEQPGFEWNPRGPQAADTYDTPSPGMGSSPENTSVDDINVGAGLSQAQTVYAYTSKEQFDRYLLPKGICSGYPVILMQAPFENYYQSRERSTDRSAIGKIVDLQNDLKDDTITKADTLVNSYYAQNPDIAVDLRAIRQKNLNFYNLTVTALADIGTSRDELVVATIPASPDDESLTRITYLMSTSDADAPVGSSTNGTRSGSPQTSDTRGKPSVTLGLPSIARFLTAGPTSAAASASPSSEEVTRTDLSVNVVSVNYATTEPQADYETLRSQLLAPSILNYPVMRTTEAYDLFRSSISSVYYGNSLKTSAQDPPYGTHIMSRIDVFNNTYSPRYRLDYSKSDATSTWSNNIIDPAGIDELDETYVTSELNQDLYPKNNDNLGSYIAVLASKIADGTGANLVASETLQSISPSSYEYEIQNTVDERITFVSRISERDTIATLDLTIPQNTTSLRPVNEIYGLASNDLETLSSNLNSVKTQIESLANTKRLYFSNQIALFLLKTMLNEFSSYFSSSILASSTNDSKYSMARAVFFRVAAKRGDTSRSEKRLFNICNHYLTEGYGMDGDTDTGIRSMFRISDDIIWDCDQSINSSRKGTFTFPGDYIDVPTFKDGLLSETSSFGMFNNIVAQVKRSYNLTSDAELHLRLISFRLFMKINLLFGMNGKLGLYAIAGGRNRILFVKSDAEGENKPTISWDKGQAAAIADICRDCLTSESPSSVNYQTHRSALRRDPNSGEYDDIFDAIRNVVDDTLRPYQHVNGVFAYYHTIVKNQIRAIKNVQDKYENIIAAYTTYGASNPDETARRLVARYTTTESIVALQERARRNIALIPGTRISTIAKRSDYYRNIVNVSHKETMPTKPSSIVVVGFPYGYFERIRLNKIKDSASAFRDETDFFGFKCNAYGADLTSDQIAEKIDYQFYFDLPTDYLTTYAGIADDYSTTTAVTTTKSVGDDTGVRLLKINTGTGFLEPVKSLAGSTSRLQFEKMMTQSVLRSYIEDVYGLYPEYAAFKPRLEGDRDAMPLPELTAAVAIASTLDVAEDRDLIVARVASTIMLHQDFMTTRMINELETGPLFDKILYLVYENDSLNSLLSEIIVEASQ